MLYKLPKDRSDDLKSLIIQSAVSSWRQYKMLEISWCNIIHASVSFLAFGFFYNILHIIFLFCTMIFNFYFLFSNLRSNCLYNESLLFMSLEYIPIAVLNALLFGVISCWYFVSFKCVSFLFILASYTKQGITNQIFVIRLQDCYWNKIRKKKKKL